jgi:transposase
MPIRGPDPMPIDKLGERGVVTSYGSVWRIVHDAELSFKKNTVRDGAAPP